MHVVLIAHRFPAAAVPKKRIYFWPGSDGVTVSRTMQVDSVSVIGWRGAEEIQTAKINLLETKLAINKSHSLGDF